MKGFWIIGSIVLIAGLVSVAGGAEKSGGSEAAEERGKDLPTEVAAVLKENCYKCHGPEKEKGDVRFDTLSSDFIMDRAAAETWHDALDVVSIGDMPPEDEPELSEAEREVLTDWIRGKLDEAIAATKGQSEGVVLRRLNNEEYRYTLTDLLGIESDYGAKLPPDPLSPDGFANEGATLGMSAMQLEYYLESARAALDSVLIEGQRPARTVDVAEESDGLNGYGDGNPGERLGRVHYFALQVAEPPRFGNFTVRVTARAELVKGQAAPLMSVDYGNKISGAIQFIENLGLSAVTSKQPKVYEFTGRAEAFPLLPLQRGTETDKQKADRDKYVQLITVSNALEDGEADPKPLPRKKGEKRSKSRVYPEDENFPKIVVEKVEFVGHDYDSWPPRAHRRILFESDQSGVEYADEVITRFFRRAWRRPPTDAEVASYLDHYEGMVADGARPFEALREILAVAISSPNFLYLVEPRADGKGRPLDDYELASRLSYFLWSSMPDAKLSALADEGKLREPGVLASEVARLLAHPKSSRFVDAFSSQWLDLAGVDRIAVNPEYYPDFDVRMKPDLIRETQEFFGEVLRTDSSALQFLDADFTMANAALARHYGLKGPRTHRFERVSLKGTKRPGGVLAHASFHLTNSDGGQSHPIKRAVWILERLLHDPPKPPPPNVPSLDQIDKDFAKLSIREQMEIHRQQAACNDCHKGIDPWGIALEGFDALGMAREEVQRPIGKGGKMENTPAVTDTVLPGGHAIDGLEALQAYLLEEREEQFTHALSAKLLTYALGRPLELEDGPAVEELAHEFAAEGHRLPFLIERIVLSEPFQSK